MRAMGDFQAVDLDAVLDQFEFHEEEKQKRQLNVERTTSPTLVTKSTTTTATAEAVHCSYVDTEAKDCEAGMNEDGLPDPGRVQVTLDSSCSTSV